MKLIEDFNEICSLEFLTGARVVIAIWNRQDIVQSITHALENTDQLEVNTMWDEIEHQILLILRSFERFPRILRDDLENMIKPTGLEIKAMRTFANFSPYFESTHWQFPVNHWTPYGTVDIKSMDKMLVQDNRRDIGFRFHLACNDCFRDTILELFTSLSDTQKSRYLEIEQSRELLSYWTYVFLGNLSTFWNLTFPHNGTEEPHEYSNAEVAFKYAIINGSKSGIEYFMDQFDIGSEYVIRKHAFALLDPFRRGYLQVRCAKHYLDAFYVLMSRLPSDTRINTLRYFRFNFLYKFLTYPFFGLDIKYASILMLFLEYRQIYQVLLKIALLKNDQTHFFGYDVFKICYIAISENYKARLLNTLDTDDFVRIEIRNALQS